MARVGGNVLKNAKVKPAMCSRTFQRKNAVKCSRLRRTQTHISELTLICHTEIPGEQKMKTKMSDTKTHRRRHHHRLSKSFFLLLFAISLRSPPFLECVSIRLWSIFFQSFFLFFGNENEKKEEMKSHLFADEQRQK